MSLAYSVKRPRDHDADRADDEASRRREGESVHEPFLSLQRQLNSERQDERGPHRGGNRDRPQRCGLRHGKNRAKDGDDP